MIGTLAWRYYRIITAMSLFVRHKRHRLGLTRSTGQGPRKPQGAWTIPLGVRHQLWQRERDHGVEEFGPQGMARMDWYYAVGGDRKGPVGEEEFQRLVRQGAITPHTLVWREGMADWQPYGGEAPPPIPGPAAEGGVICAGCGRRFSGSEVISLTGGFYCAACKPMALQRLREGAIATTAVEEIRNHHLKHEASVKSIGVLYYLGGAALLVVGAVSLFSGGARGGGFETALMPAVLLLIGAGQIWVGTGLRRLRKWARLPTGILSGFGLLGFPVGTLINGYILYLVFSQKGKMVFSDEYQAVIEQTPHLKYRTSLIIWILLGLVLLLVAAGLIAAIFARR